MLLTSTTLLRGYDKKRAGEKNRATGKSRHDTQRARDTSSMGFNPHRKQKKRASDIYLVVGALVITMALVVWAFRG
jgi:hypothetical protein